MSDLSFHPPTSQYLMGDLLRFLCESGVISFQIARAARAASQLYNLRVEDVLTSRFGVSTLSIAEAQSKVHQTQVINPTVDAPDLRAIDSYGAATVAQTGLLPWRQMAGAMVILTAKPDEFHKHQDQLSTIYGKVRMAIATADMIQSSLQRSAKLTLTHHAETMVPLDLSSRSWNTQRMLMGLLVAAVVVATASVVAGAKLLVMLCMITIVILLMNSILKAAAAVACYSARPLPRLQFLPSSKLPVITLLVPLFREKEIAQHLLERLNQLDYPRELLDVCLVTESDDETTRMALGQTNLPMWMKSISVPQGTLRTKPRALNYAMHFARGSIIGVYDAEDAPDPDQLHHVASTFANRPKEVACLQGILDYYNAKTNWLTRCFAIEYAAWFRIVLPGLQRMGFVVPLGGTTLFFRRTVLDELGGWDAHNVTEDADLGVRLARFGYRTELIDTVTQEEANGRFWPWIKQRSRWLKGYAITYSVHMRNPRKLWQDLGPRRFWGVQLLFAGTLAQFILAPVLWSFWIVPFGVPHPFFELMSPPQFWTMVGMFFAAELINLTVAAIALHRAKSLWLLKWAITLQVYFPLASLGAYKGLLELAWKPYYWDKTTHGVLLPQDPP